MFSFKSLQITWDLLQLEDIFSLTTFCAYEIGKILRMMESTNQRITLVLIRWSLLKRSKVSWIRFHFRFSSTLRLGSRVGYLENPHLLQQKTQLLQSNPKNIVSLDFGLGPRPPQKKKESSLSNNKIPKKKWRRAFENWLCELIHNPGTLVPQGSRPLGLNEKVRDFGAWEGFWEGLSRIPPPKT